jgi:hypothetical protein
MGTCGWRGRAHYDATPLSVCNIHVCTQQVRTCGIHIKPVNFHIKYISTTQGRRASLPVWEIYLITHISGILTTILNRKSAFITNEFPFVLSSKLTEQNRTN